MAAEPEVEITLNINGKEIGMNEFVRKITGNLLLAILKSLRLDEEPKSATFSVKIK
jgi:hypothetical protein